MSLSLIEGHQSRGSRILPQPFSVGLISSRATATASGTMHIKVGFVRPLNSTTISDFSETYNALIKHSRPSLVSAPPVRICDFPNVIVYDVYYRPKGSAQSAPIRVAPSMRMTGLVLTRRSVRTARLPMMRMKRSPRLLHRTETASLSQATACHCPI